jgi:protein TonB
MRNERKSPRANLKKFYTIILEAGGIIALLFMIALVKVNLETEPPKEIVLDEQEAVEMEEVIQTKRIETPPPPPRPPVPVEVPNDEIIEDERVGWRNFKGVLNTQKWLEKLVLKVVLPYSSL